jgi:hypothetical protein
MDVIYEGKITPEEGMAEAIQNVIDIGNANGILRITCEETGVQGRIGFSVGAFVVGAKVNFTNEVGYPALRKLMAIQKGNYAVLDPGRQIPQELNQTLWIRGSAIVPLLPNLPESADALIDGNPNVLKAQVERPGTGQRDFNVPVERDLSEPETTVGSLGSKSRQFNVAAWRTFVTIVVLLVSIFIVLLLAQYGQPVWQSYFHPQH